MAAEEESAPTADAAGEKDPAGAVSDADVKVILLGDSAVGKSKLVERFLMDDYQPRQLSTYALTLFRHVAEVEDKKVQVDFWDTAGQERFSSMHPSYYYKAHACILVFDVTRKATYVHLKGWFQELRKYCEAIPVICVANKIDVDINVTNKRFKFPEKHKMPFFWVSAADGTNVVFEEAIRLAWQYKNQGDDFFADVMQLLDDDKLGE